MPRVLYVHTQGAVVAVAGEHLVVHAPRAAGGGTVRVGLPRLGRLVLVGRVQLTAPALARCLAAGVGVAWLTRRGALVGHVAAAADQPAATVRAQCLASADPVRRLAVARALVAAKIGGERNVLLRRARRLPPGSAREAVGVAARRLRLALGALAAAGDLDALRGLEGAAAAAYFEAWPALLDGAALAFGGRSRRPPRDEVNALLSFAYTLVHAQVRGLAEVHGLHPQVGFLHADRPGHAALASDLIEPVRPALDHAVLAAVRNGRFAVSDFDVSARGGVYLSADARPRFLALVERVVRTPRPWTDGPPVSLWARMAAETARVAAALRDGTPVEVAPFVGAARPAA